VEQRTRHVHLDHALLERVLVQRAARHVAGALGRRGQVAEGVPAAGAVLRAARGAVEQAGDGAGAGAAGLLVVELGAAERDVAVPGPVLEAGFTRQAVGELEDVVAVLLNARPQDIQRLVEGEVGVRGRPRGQDRTEVGRDERVGDRNRQAVDVRGQGGVGDAHRDIVGEGELREELDAVGQVVVDLGEHGVAVEVRLHRAAVVAEVHLLRGAGGVGVDDVGVVGLRVAEVQDRHARGRKQGLVGVEADLAGVAAGAVAGQGGGAVGPLEQAVDRGQGGQVGAEQHRALRDGRQARGRGAED
ncbi:conserved hypothetical protein, partial [Ricinus communis]